MSDYGGLGAIVREAQSMPVPEVVACPKCGALLDVNQAGVKNCPMGHFRA